MGCGSSKEETDSGEAPARAERGSGNNDSTIQGTSTKKHEWSESRWVDDTKEIWARKIDDLPVHMDVPRLGAKLRILREGEKITREESIDLETLAKPQLVYEVLLTMVEGIEEEEEVAQKIKDEFFNYVNSDGSGDISMQLLSFLKEILTKETKIGRVLKACHQKIVFPAFYSIKSAVYDEMPFKDLRGTWVMSVDVRSGGGIFVNHRKRQRSKAGNAEDAPEFSFEWQLSLQFDQDVNELKEVKVDILSLEVADWLDDEKRKAVTDVFHAHYKIEEE